MFFGRLLAALGLDPAAPPSWWQGWPAQTHVRRWIDDLGLAETDILAAATASRVGHPAPPDGPKALDRTMQRAALALKRSGMERIVGGETGGKSDGRTTPARRNRSFAPLPSADDLAVFYAGLVNSEKYLPANTISNTVRDAMLARGLVTPERLTQRGVR